VRALQFAVALTVGCASVAAAQLAAPQQPTQRLLVLPFQAASADSAASIALADLVRDRITALTKNKVMVVPKAKLCEALKASGFPCDGLLDDQQARQLARFLQVHAYLTGTFVKNGAELKADVHLIDISSSGMTGSFTATNGNPGTAAALADAIAQKVATVVRISEPVRNCNDERKKGQFARARAEAQKAIAVDPNATGAWLCIATIYEAQRMPVDSIVSASMHALLGDSLNSAALENLARAYQQKGDTLKALQMFVKQLQGEPRNTQKRLAIAQQYRQMKQYDRAIELLDDGLKIQPGDAQLLELELAICNEAGKFTCSSHVFYQKAQHDTALVADTTFLKPAIGAAQQASDTVALAFFTAAAVRHFPHNASFIRTRAAAFELAGTLDSALVYYKKALAIDPNDVATSLQIAKILIDRAVYDTAQARQLRERKDSIGLRMLQQAFAARVDSARPFLRPGLASADSMQRLAGSVIMLTGGSKLAQAAAYDEAYGWLDTLLQVVAPKSASDTLGPRFQVRLNASFWYGLSSTLTFGKEYGRIAKLKPGDRPARCEQARELKDRLLHTKAAMTLGRRIHPPTADQMLGFIAQYERALPQVGKAFKCANF